MIAAASAIALVMVLVHFALFVSACRYTHERRRRRYMVTEEKVKEEATVIAREIIDQMAREGRLVPPRQPAVTDNGHAPEESQSSPVMPRQAPPEIFVHSTPDTDAEILSADKGKGRAI